jgi:hypothetical protein
VAVQVAFSKQVTVAAVVLVAIYLQMCILNLDQKL